MFAEVVQIKKAGSASIKLAIVSGLLLLGTTVFATPDRVTVAWDPNPEPDIAQYKVYYGVVNSVATNVLSVASGTQRLISGLQAQKQYWFYVTAQNTAGMESDPSVVLFHTTPSNAAPTVTLGLDRLIVVPAPVKLRAAAADDYLAPEALTTTWTQVSGPSTPISNGNKLESNVQINSPGTYRYRVTVSDGTFSAQDDFQLTAVSNGGPPPPGSVVPNIAFVASTFDGLIVAWNSSPGAVYTVGFKEDLNASGWQVLASNIQSMGLTTYWVDDRGYPAGSGFFAIFQVQ